MMGERLIEQPALFYEFSLDGHVPQDHLLRASTGSSICPASVPICAPFYSDMGRPSIDPELMIRMLLWATASASAPSAGSARRST
jgi:hypothetical protein